MPGFAEGGWWVQDAAATLPVLLLGDVAGKKCDRSLRRARRQDLAIGGAGAQVTAVEIGAGRAPRGCAKIWPALNLSAEVGRKRCARFRRHRAFGAARCALHRHRHHPPPSRSALDQERGRCDGADGSVLRTAGKRARQMVEPEGLLVFAVCSLEREESEEQIAAFLSGHREFQQVPVTPEEVFGHGEWISPQGDLRHLALSFAGPGRHGRLLRRQAPQIISVPEARQINLTGIGGENGRSEQPPPSPSRARASRASNSPI